MIRNILIIVFIFSLVINAQVFTEKDVEICKVKFKLAEEQKLAAEPIGKIITAIGKSFIGTDYEAHTLDKDTSEALVINLSGLDCTTYVENVFAISRCIKKSMDAFKNFEDELKEIRYRNGVINGFTSRLNYFSDWIYDNEKKGILKNISGQIGGEPIQFKVNFMSSHPNLYFQLRENHALIPIIRKQEEKISGRTYFFIPKNKVAAVESKIHSGDIIAFTSSIKGLDVSHTGIAVRMEDGKIHLMNAPNVGLKVRINKETLSSYISRIKKDTGIMVLRAIEPK